MLNFIWFFLIIFASFVAWVVVPVVLAGLLWVAWSYVFDGAAAIDGGIVSSVDETLLFNFVVVVPVVALVISFISIILTTTKRKVKWALNANFIELDKGHSLRGIATSLAPEIRLKPPQIFLYQSDDKVPSMFPIGSISRSAVCFEASLFDDVTPDELTWLVTRGLVMHETMYGFLTGVLVGALWPKYLGQKLINLSRLSSFYADQQAHSVVVAFLLLPISLLGLILVVTGKLIRLLQLPFQRLVVSREINRASDRATAINKTSGLSILDRHIFGIDLVVGR
jgi:hypothetical protein